MAARLITLELLTSLEEEGRWSLFLPIRRKWTALDFAQIFAALSKLHAYETFWELLERADSSQSGERFLTEVGIYRDELPMPGGRSLDVPPTVIKHARAQALELPVEDQAARWHSLADRIRRMDVAPLVILAPGFSQRWVRYHEYERASAIDRIERALESREAGLASPSGEWGSPGRIYFSGLRRAAHTMRAFLEGEVQAIQTGRRLAMKERLLKQTQRRLELIHKYGEEAFNEAYLAETRELIAASIRDKKKRGLLANNNRYDDDDDDDDGKDADNDDGADDVDDEIE
jgi:hypothetical protein